jgi:hypothetical protein
MKLAALVLPLSMALALSACPQNAANAPTNPDASDAATGPNFQAITQVVLQDLEAGKTLPQIETDVAALVAGQQGVDVLTLVDDAIKLLVDLNDLPATAQTYAVKLRGQIADAHRLQLTKPN